MAERQTILRMQGITKDFSGVRALDDVTLEVTRGEVHAICGENGAGKSTLMKVLSGVHPHGTYSGTIELNDTEARFADINASEAAGIVIIHQELALNPLQSIAENIFLGNERSTRGVIDWDRTAVEAAELLELVGLAGVVSTARAGSAVVSAGQNYELDAIAAVFIGGAAVQGGVGTVTGAVIGGLVMGVLNMGLSILSVDAAWQMAIKGLVLLLAVAFDLINKRRGGR